MHISSDRITKGFIFLVFKEYGGMACNIVFSLLLTRLLAPADFGTIAIILFYFTLFNWVSEWGWEQAFMAHKEISIEQAASTHLVLRAVFGIVPLLTFCVSDALLNLSLSSEMRAVMFMLAFVHFFEKVGLTYKTILERMYKLKELAYLEFMLNITSYIVAVLAAWNGFGVYSLVLQRTFEKGLISVGYMFFSPWKVGFSFDFGIVKTFLRSFGVATWLSAFFGVTLYEFMPFLIGLFAGKHQAGLYAKAFSIGTFPLMLTGVFARLTIPLYTQYQKDAGEIRRVFVRSQSIKVFLLIPGQCVLALFASYWIPKVLGAKWHELVTIYQVMAVYGLFRAFYDDVPPVLMYGYRDVWAFTKNQMIQSIFILTVGVGCVYYGQALGGAIAMSLMMAGGTILFWFRVASQISLKSRDFVTFFRQAPAWILRRLGSMKVVWRAYEK